MSSLSATYGVRVWAVLLLQSSETLVGECRWQSNSSRQPRYCSWSHSVRVSPLAHRRLGNNPLTGVESPRYLISKGRREEAIKNLNRLRPQHEVEAGTTIAELDAIETMMNEEEGNHEGRWIDLFGRRYIKRTAVSLPSDWLAAL